jgi:uncharacterized membrane protein
MKKAFFNFTNHHKLERTGILTLFFILLILIAIRISIPFWHKPNIPIQEEARFQQQWDTFKRYHTDSLQLKIRQLNTTQ